MLKVGLTGGIGSGKTVVSDRFEKLGAPVIDTDVLAREVAAAGTPALNGLVRVFGGEILKQDGSLDRERLRRIVFDDHAAKKKVEAILHPAIRGELDERLEELETLDPPYCVIVVPLLVETDFQEMVDRVLVVEAPRESRIHWVMERSGMSRKEVEQVMESQATSEQRLRVAQDILNNDGTLTDIQEKADRLHAKYLVAPKLTK